MVAKQNTLKNQASALRVAYWQDEHGQKRKSLSLDEMGEGYKILFCFQSWCPGCHSHGFPALQYLIENLPQEGFSFAVIQTVFEGAEKNTVETTHETQQKYALKIPFGHDYVEGGRPTIMEDYNTGGTPWFIIINPSGEVMFSDFRINPQEVVRLIGQQAE